jgi:uncharacterized protein YndB with AHSA1/START domain
MVTARDVEFTRIIQASPGEVYRAFTHPATLEQWLCDEASVEARPGGHVFLRWFNGYYAVGEFTDLQRDKSLTFTWHGRGHQAPSQVHVVLDPYRTGTHITLTHQGIGSGWNQPFYGDAALHDWATSLENLQSILETGYDLRITRRPMVGLYGGSTLDAETAVTLGLPVSQGLVLQGFVPGMAAERAGLQDGDVLVSLAGTPITDFNSIGTALTGRQAGEQVEAVIYRGGQRQPIQIKLSGRPVHETPQSAEALAEAVRQVYAQIDAERSDFLNSLSEEEASQRPTPEMWSAKELLAHLIVSERDAQSYTSVLIAGEGYAGEFASNLPARLHAVIAAYPTLKKLLEEVRRTEAETIAILSAVPPESLARRGNMQQLVGTFVDAMPYHTRTHLNQLREAIEAVRVGVPVPG